MAFGSAAGTSEVAGVVDSCGGGSGAGVAEGTGASVEGTAGGVVTASSISRKLGAVSKTSAHCPQRTQPSDMRSWSRTTLNVV